MDISDRLGVSQSVGYDIAEEVLSKYESKMIEEIKDRYKKEKGHEMSDEKLNELESLLGRQHIRRISKILSKNDKKLNIENEMIETADDEKDVLDNRQYEQIVRRYIATGNTYGNIEDENLDVEEIVIRLNEALETLSVHDCIGVMIVADMEDGNKSFFEYSDEVRDIPDDDLTVWLVTYAEM